MRDLTQEQENERLAAELRSLNERLEERIEIATKELAERNRLLVWQIQELEKASLLKSEFLARMSHELRTPINAMLGYTSLLRERIYGDLTIEQEKALEKIRAASKHLLTLISEILDLSKIEAGKMPVRLERVRLEQLVAEIGQTLGPLFDDRGLAFRIELSDELPTLRTDPTKLRQVLLNLLENALKYTREGWVALRAYPQEGGRLRIEVEDTGIGIAEEDQELIFEDFRQADQSSDHEYGGTGLGLSISRKLLALLGGTIAVRSEAGKGSVFTVEIPVRSEPGTVDEQARRVLIEGARQEVAEDGHSPAAAEDGFRSPDPTEPGLPRPSAETERT